MPWDQIAVFAIIAAAVAYLAWGMFGRRGRSGCGGCQQCPGAKMTSSPESGNLVQIEIPRRKKVT